MDDQADDIPETPTPPMSDDPTEFEPEEPKPEQ